MASYLNFALLFAVFSVGCSARSLMMTEKFCKTQSLQTNLTFNTCVDLPTLGATLHWNYDSMTGDLDLAFTASNPGGWIAWGINPTGLRMLGTQAMVAVFDSSSMVVTPYTYNISSYSSVIPGPISFPYSNLTAVVDDFRTAIFAHMMLTPETTTVNTVWQVGPMNGTRTIAMHSMDYDNLNSVLKLDLIQPDVGSPAPAPSPSPMAM
ncbi:hypothetical protein ZOSMA_56G00580 [Zostera marina]|uniref:DOMON domain-containing protein n=1 Tax=Zostera marina TaxID=29655 RepID=A0A0K9NXQ1_ZOSMR|nr:hypothetical protein ZOSMA_56G00580 [Zostera marina]